MEERSKRPQCGQQEAKQMRQILFDAIRAGATKIFLVLSSPAVKRNDGCPIGPNPVPLSPPPGYVLGSGGGRGNYGRTVLHKHTHARGRRGGGRKLHFGHPRCAKEEEDGGHKSFGPEDHSGLTSKQNFFMYLLMMPQKTRNKLFPNSFPLLN